MTRRFNITGSCSLQRHYMVSLDNRLRSIKQNYVEDGNHFVINKGRQYGKTTTLGALEEYLGGAWSPKGVEKAVLMILKENPVLFESMAKQLNTYADLHEIIESIIYRRVCCCKICR